MGLSFEQRLEVRVARSARAMVAAPWIPDDELDAVDGVCPACGTEFVVAGGGATRRRWCSVLCRKRASLHRERMREAA